MTIIRSVFCSLFFLLLLRCDKNSLRKNEFLEPNNKFIENISSKSNKVVITGNTDDIPAFKVLNIMNETYLFGKSHLDFTKELFSDSLHLVLDSIDRPLLSHIITASKSLYEGYAFLIPGDTINIKIKNGSMEFFGKNAILNNFYSKMIKKTPAYSKNPYEGNIMLYKNNVENIYFKKRKFLNQYVIDNNIKSELFIETFETFLKHEYLFSLIQPKNIEYGKLNNYIGEVDGLLPIVQQESIKNPEIIIDLHKYFGNISIEDFKDEIALNHSSFFKENINPYIRYYFLDSKHNAYSKEMFIEEKEFIKKNFDGELENYAIARMLRDYHTKGFGNSINTIEIMKNTISEYKDKFIKPSYINYMNDMNEDLMSYKFELRESVLNSKFINCLGDTLTLNKIFSRSNKRIKVINFWASWCPPCIKQIKQGKPFKDRISVENNVEWIYISPEKDYKKWLEKNIELKKTLNFYNSFFLLNGLNSPFAKSFNVKELPRYIILNQENKIVLNNAPSPLDEKIFEDIIRNLREKQ